MKILRKIDRSSYKEFIGYAGNCTANRVYPTSIAAGIQDGEIYADDNGCVLFWHYCGFGHISGNVSVQVLEEIYQRFLTADTERRFVLITDSEFVSDHYSGREMLRSDKRIEYSYVGMPEDPPRLDDRYVVERITKDNIGCVRERITPSFSWEDSGHFLRDGSGFIARSKEDGSFAAVAFSSAVSPDEVDIGVETAEVHRRHGLASYLAYRMIEEVLRQGKRPVWACHSENTASMKLAEKIGFVKSAECYTVRNK